MTTTLVHRHAHETCTITCGHATPAQAIEQPMANYPRCPVCGSWDVQRNSEFGRVWFSCRRCGITFN